LALDLGLVFGFFGSSGLVYEHGNPKTQKNQAPTPNPNSKTQRNQVPNPNQKPRTQKYLGFKKNPKKHIH
jgi:hypothetical protein